MDGNMNDTRENGQEFSLKRQERTWRDTGKDNTVEDSAAKSASAENASSATMGDNALPDRIRRKYYVVVNEPGKEGADGKARLYADDKGEYLAFKVADDRLVTRLAAVEVIRDMVSVAQHRQWASLEVRGSVDSVVRRGSRPARVAWRCGAISRASSTGRRSPIGKKSGTVPIRAVRKQRLGRFLTKMSAPKDLTTTKVSRDA